MIDRLCSCDPCHHTCGNRTERKPEGAMQALEAARESFLRHHHIQPEIPDLTNDPRDVIVGRVK